MWKTSACKVLFEEFSHTYNANRNLMIYNLTDNTNMHFIFFIVEKCGLKHFNKNILNGCF